MKTVIASKNEGKIREIKDILNLKWLEFLTYKDFEKWPEVEETGKNFEENAILKAQKLAECLKLPAFADDSGLEVDVLGGEPGIYSSRYAGEFAKDEDNIKKLLSKLRSLSINKRTARFKCSAVLFIPNGKIFKTEGVCEGHIINEPRGSNGFGYDPVFVPKGYDKTMAELPVEIKNKISHRGQAFRKLKEILKEIKF
ncbi:XTP/dITP diphosphatase [Candidatus Oleimmundimicrobium sp.]|uniref:XTP/dITP diphosphatase n=1 Tax=Candidatus Oleimmundimicrobium sp. TaxID=3060597 RepID=UPI00271D3CC6|nr:XTP/dITP diphosphatase [Candidatus Oleimmundimicrobium sp.]MDO8885873.1 XTP/dITP diphosphatase [Candidatus Oleimmundimicrobium sp.]